MTLELCEKMLGSGLSLELGTLDRPGHRPVPDFVRRFLPSPGPRRLGASSQMHQWLRRGARNGETGILHSHSIWTMSSVYPGWVAQASWTPLVVSPHGTFAKAALASGSRFKGAFWRFVQRPALAAATCFHATSPGELWDIRRQGFTQPIAVIPIGIDVGAPQRLLGSQRTLLFLGRVHPIKQPDVLLRAWQLLEQEFPDWRLRIVGADHDSPGFLEEMRRLSDSLGLARVQFDGELVGTAKLDAFRSSDLYVLPSKSENFGVTVAESLAAGTPAVVSTGAPWLEISAKGAGWTSTPTPDMLCKTLREAMSRPRSELEAMGNRGRAWMSAEYRWDSVANRMLEFYDWIITGMPSSRKPEWVHLAPGSMRDIAAHWTGEQRAEVVIRMLRGESLEALSRELGLSTARLAAWREDGLSALRTGLTPDPLSEGQ